MEQLINGIGCSGWGLLVDVMLDGEVTDVGDAGEVGEIGEGGEHAETDSELASDWSSRPSLGGTGGEAPSCGEAVATGV